MWLVNHRAKHRYPLKMSYLEVTAILGNVGEFVGSIAVLATLIYLAVQVRQSRDLLKKQEVIAMSQVYSQRSLMRMEFAWRQMGTPEQINALRSLRYTDEGHPGWEGLSPSQKVTAYGWNMALMVHQDHNLYQLELGLLDDRALESTHEVIMESYERWQTMELAILPRVVDYYATQRAQGAT